MIEFIIILATGVVGFAVGWWLSKCTVKKAQMQQAIELFESAQEEYKVEKYQDAFYLLSKASCLYEHPDIFNLMGCSAKHLGQYEIEARCFDRGCDAIVWGLFRDRKHDLAYFYYRAAHAYMRASNWEFSWLRACVGLSAIRSGKVPAVIDNNLNIEQELAAIRMVAALHHFTGTEAFENANIDAQWLRNHATSPRLIRLSEGLLLADNATRQISLELFTRDWKSPPSPN